MEEVEVEGVYFEVKGVEVLVEGCISRLRVEVEEV